MEEKLIIELDDDKIKYGVFETDEESDYKLLTKKISNNAGIEKGKILDLDQSTKNISADLHNIEKKVSKVFKSISVVLNQKDVFCTNLSGFKKLNGSKVEKRDLDYILNEAKNSISKNQRNNSILHILNSNFILDKTKQKKMPINIFGDLLSLDMTFVSIPENNLKNIKEIFSKSDLKIDRVISKPFAENINLLNLNKNLKNFISINFGNELTTISLCQNSSLVFFKTFPFGTNSIYNDIKQLCSINKNEIAAVLDNLQDNQSGYIDKKFFVNSNYKKLSINHFMEIINARIKEIINFTFNNNKNLDYYEKRIEKINLFFEDACIYKNLGHIFKEYLNLNDNIIGAECLSRDDIGTLYGAAELLFNGWPNEAIPFSNRKKSIISGFFERFFY
jgi:cell division protein FtsA